MLRITSSTRDGTRWVRIEGNLVGPWVAECRDACAQSAEPGQRLALDLSELSFADAEGVEFLRQMADAGHIESSPGFVTELLRREELP